MAFLAPPAEEVRLERVKFDDLSSKIAAKKRDYEGPPRPELLAHARSVLERAFNAEEAAARGIRLRK